MEQAGADALEINVFTFPGDITLHGYEVEKDMLKSLNGSDPLFTYPLQLN